MSKTKKLLKNRIIQLLGKIFGIVFFLFGVAVLIDAIVRSDSEHSFEKLSVAYFVIIFGLAVFMLNIDGPVSNYSDISGKGFITCAILPFGLFFSFILKINTYVSLFEPIDIGNIWLISQAITTGVWFAHKVITKKTWQEVELMKLDLYITVSMVPLTLVWVIFKIDTVKLGFAIILGEFLIIQFMIKMTQIKSKEQKDNSN